MRYSNRVQLYDADTWFYSALISKAAGTGQGEQYRENVPINWQSSLKQVLSLSYQSKFILRECPPSADIKPNTQQPLKFPLDFSVIQKSIQAENLCAILLSLLNLSRALQSSFSTTYSAMLVLWANLLTQGDAHRRYTIALYWLQLLLSKNYYFSWPVRARLLPGLCMSFGTLYQRSLFSFMLKECFSLCGLLAYLIYFSLRTLLALCNRNGTTNRSKHEFSDNQRCTSF